MRTFEIKLVFDTFIPAICVNVKIKISKGINLPDLTYEKKILFLQSKFTVTIVILLFCNIYNIIEHKKLRY